MAIAEAFSWTGLLIGMFFKYVVVGNEIGVKIFGPIHGALFTAYVVLTLAVAVRNRWHWTTALVGLICSIPPLATLVFERWARRRGLLRERGVAETPEGLPLPSETGGSATHESA
ncbi:integral membrane protein [Catenuloplanes nepalensis]|uniref:Integral membrane protein n=1 Tax=Catenuloplanes nepalensis TaxID=587533 RepID=A0ABT9MWG3_9ACTN|nr:integral membrane protein [Catenuloplanes nepalensis]